jgi:hypothetical protein
MKKEIKFTISESLHTELQGIVEKKKENIILQKKEKNYTKKILLVRCFMQPNKEQKIKI